MHKKRFSYVYITLVFFAIAIIALCIYLCITRLHISQQLEATKEITEAFSQNDRLNQEEETLDEVIATESNNIEKTAFWQLADMKENPAPGDFPKASYATAKEVDVLYYHMDAQNESHYYVNRLKTEGVVDTIQLLGIPSDISMTSFAAGNGLFWLLGEYPNLQAEPQRLFCFDEAGNMIGNHTLSNKMMGELHTSMEDSVWIDDYISETVYQYTSDGVLKQAIPMPQDGMDMLMEGNGCGLYGLHMHKDGKGIDVYPLGQTEFQEPMEWDITEPDLILPGNNGLFLFAKDHILYEYYPESGQQKELFSFSENGISEAQIFGIITGKNEEMYVLWEGSQLNCYRMSTLQKSLEGYKDDIITMAAVELSEKINELVTLYNRADRPYKIHIVEYTSQIGESTEKEDAQNRLNADLIAGDQIDILDLSGIEDCNIRRQYAELGVLENLYPWMERDAAFRQEEYQTQVWKANEIDGCLYNMVPFFGIDTVFGKESLYGQRMQIKPEEVMNVDMPLLVYGKNYTTSDILRAYCQYVLDGTVNDVREQMANTERLEMLFRFAASYPETGIGGEYIIDLRQGNQWMHAVGNSSNDSMDRMMETYMECIALMGENASMIGYPTDQGIGSAFCNTVSFGMCASSHNKEAVWDFFQFLLSDEMQMDTEKRIYFKNDIPVKVSAWEDACHTAMSLEQGNGVGIFREDQEWYVVYPVISSSQVDLVNQLISQITRVREYDMAIAELFEEELQNYRNGSKSLQDSVSHLQSRVGMYLDELE